MCSCRQGATSLTPTEHSLWRGSQLIKKEENKPKDAVSTVAHLKTVLKRFLSEDSERRTHQPTAEGTFCWLKSVTQWSIQNTSFSHLLPTLFRHGRRQDGVLPVLLTVPVQCGHGEKLSPWDELQAHLAVSRHLFLCTLRRTFRAGYPKQVNW